MSVSLFLPAVANTLCWVLRALRRKLQRPSADLVALLEILEAALSHDRAPCCNILRRCTELQRTRCFALQRVLRCNVLYYVTARCTASGTRHPYSALVGCGRCARVRLYVSVRVRVRGRYAGLKPGEYVPRSSSTLDPRVVQLLAAAAMSYYNKLTPSEPGKKLNADSILQNLVTCIQVVNLGKLG
jgi:hypothetical protein